MTSQYIIETKVVFGLLIFGCIWNENFKNWCGSHTSTLYFKSNIFPLFISIHFHTSFIPLNQTHPKLQYSNYSEDYNHHV